MSNYKPRHTKITDFSVKLNGLDPRNEHRHFLKIDNDMRYKAIATQHKAIDYYDMPQKYLL